jgi:hypothetical protein
MLTHVTHGSVCLGKKSPRRSLRSLPFGNYVKPSALAFPPVVAWERGIDWGMLGNDSVGDCTCADVLHHRMLQVSVAHAGSPLSFNTQDAISLYSAVAGYVPGDPSTDKGAVMLDVQNYSESVGLGGVKTDGFVTLDVNNIDQIKAALYILGGIDLGFSVPAYIMNVSAGGSWSESGGDDSIVGGHAVLGCGFGRSGMRVVSWGTTYTLNWEFWAKYVDEAYAWVSQDWIKQSGVSPTGLDVNTLLDDLKTL